MDAPKSEIILYQTEDGRTRVQCRFENENVWMTQALMAKLFQTTVPNINLHLRNIYEENELSKEATIKKYLIVRFEGARQVTPEIEHYIKLFFKLPDWFKIETPLGTYNPDWAIVKEDETGQNKVYLVRETKGTTVWMKIPEIQRKKIQCGKAHFKAVGFKDGEYEWVSSAKDV